MNYAKSGDQFCQHVIIAVDGFSQRVAKSVPLLLEVYNEAMA